MDMASSSREGIPSCMSGFERILQRIDSTSHLGLHSLGCPLQHQSPEFETVNIAHRFVLRSQGALPAKKIAQAQSLYKHENARLNHLLHRVLNGITSPLEMLIYVAIISFCEERLRHTMIAVKFRPTDFGLRRPFQRLLESFFEDHRRFPNSEERRLFRLVFRVPEDIIIRWFLAKFMRVRPHLTLLFLLERILWKPSSERPLSNNYGRSTIKPYTEH